jgi:hypothetical protein
MMKTPHLNLALLALSTCPASLPSAVVARAAVANSPQPAVSLNSFHLTREALSLGFRGLRFLHVEIRSEGGETVKVS